MENWNDDKKYMILESWFNSRTSLVLNSVLHLDSGWKAETKKGSFTLAEALATITDRFGDRINEGDDLYVLERDDLKDPIILSPSSLKLFADTLFTACPNLCVSALENLLEGGLTEKGKEDVDLLRDKLLDKISIYNIK